MGEEWRLGKRVPICQNYVFVSVSTHSLASRPTMTMTITTDCGSEAFLLSTELTYEFGRETERWFYKKAHFPMNHTLFCRIFL